MKEKNIKTSLAPIIDKESRILILGTLPGTESLNSKKYYNNKSNDFWKIMELIFHTDFNELDKRTFLQRNHLALWDVYKKAEIKGDSDNNIKNSKSEYNNFKSLFAQYPNINKILLNGKKAEKGFKKYLKIENISNINYMYVPSSSGANRRYYTLEQKVVCWNNALK